jgi:predicted unusual protein kinase regulating ubiquinone biosynthesis (AarF/ABC1/UbiB family)
VSSADGRIRRSRAARTLQPAGLAARSAGRWFLSHLAVGDGRSARREASVIRNAEDVTRTLGEMKGAAMKIGQVLSLMTGMVPDEMAGRLTSLQSSAPPMAYELVRSVLIEEYGAPPQRLFRDFERQPFAAASIGQVHRARLPSGERVAVKVQYPGVREAIDHDLANVGLLLGAAGVVAKGLDVRAIVDDLKEGIRGELDYVREAASQERFGAIYRGHGFVRIPWVYRDLTRPRVLVQEYIEGRPLAAAVDLPRAERDALAEKIFRFAFGNFYRHRLFNGDPHPGNYLLCDDGRVAFLDFGCVVDFEQEAVDRFRALLAALFDGDLEAWRAAAERVGILRPEAPFTTEELYEHMHWFWKPVLSEEVTFTRELAAEMVRRNSQTTGHGGAINKHLNIPRGMVFLTRINFGLAGMFAGLEATGRWRAIISEYVYGLPPQTPLGELSAATSPGAWV